MTAIVPKILFSFDKKCRSVYKFGLMSWTPRNISYFTLGHRLHDCHFFGFEFLGTRFAVRLITACHHVS